MGLKQIVIDRISEPELMDDEAQALAYALADFEEPHGRFIELFREAFPETPVSGTVLDLGCGPADITLRFARAYPNCRLHGIDGAANMLRFGREAITTQGLSSRIQLIHGYLPGAELPQGDYDVVISNSLMHHLNNPSTLWQAVKEYAKSGAPVFVMDLMRPDSREQAEAMVETYAANEPDVLRHDFFHSLLAAYRIEEVRRQLDASGLGGFAVTAVSDRHWVASGRMP